MNATRLLTLAAAVTLGLGAASVANGHSGGKAEPRIAAGLGGQGLARDLVVRLRDADSGKPVSGALVTVSPSMSRPHTMRLQPWRLVPSGRGRYTTRFGLPMSGVWRFRIAVTGDDVVPASATLRARIRSSAAATPTPVATLPTRLEDTLTGSDFTRMTVLWIHGLAAMGWIIGVVVMAIALASDPAVLGGGVRARLSHWYRRIGVWLHWALVPVIVATGVYNMLRVTPFPLAWTPREVRSLADIPYGALYEAILIVKLSLFAALLITGTHVLRRTIRSAPVSIEAPRGGVLATLWRALGPAGIVYVASVPLILAAAMALRYVHILSHVATVLKEGS